MSKQGNCLPTFWSTLSPWAAPASQVEVTLSPCLLNCLTLWTLSHPRDSTPSLVHSRAARRATCPLTVAPPETSTGSLLLRDSWHGFQALCHLGPAYTLAPSASSQPSRLPPLRGPQSSTLPDTTASFYPSVPLHRFLLQAGELLRPSAPGAFLHTLQVPVTKAGPAASTTAPQCLGPLPSPGPIASTHLGGGMA